MRKITSLLMLFCMCVCTAFAQNLFKTGARTTTLEAGKKYFIGAATFYSNARYNLLYNNGGDLTYSETKPNAIIDNDSYLFTVEEVGDDNTYYVKNSDGKYLLFDNKTSTETKTSITVVPYASVKGTKTCGDDVQACDENGNKIEYNAITNETPVVCVYDGTSEKGWRHISGLEFARPTPFAFYEVEEVSLLPELTTDVNAPKLYTIKNLRANKYATYNGTTQSMSLKSSVDNIDGLFYFTAGANGTYKIHNLATSNKCASHNSWTEDGIDWYIQKSENTKYTGVAISSQNDLTNDEYSWNNFQGKGLSVNYWNGNDEGSVWVINEFEGDISELGLKMSTANAENLYFIKNLRSGKYANFVAKDTQFTQVDNTGYGSYWYFVEKTDAENVPDGYKACYIYNAACNLGVENPSNGNMAALDADPYPTKLYYVRTYEYGNNWGYVMYSPDDNNGWCDLNAEGQLITNYDYKDAGSIWSLIPADKTAAQLISEATTAKNNALNYISAAGEADFYTHPAEDVATAKAAIEGVDVSTLDGAVSSLLNGAVSTPMATLQATAKGTTGPAAGQYIQLKNRKYGKYLKATDTGLNSVTDKNDFATLWLVVEGTDGNVKLKNASTKKYIGQIRQSADVAMVEAADAKQFAFTNQVDCYAVFKETTGGNYAYGHIAGHNVLVGWVSDADATQWVISEYSLNESLADLQEIYDVVDNAFGTEPGQYKEMEPSPSDELYAAWAYVGGVLGNDEAKDVYMMSILASDLKAKWNTQLANPDSREINLPVQGKFYRLKNVASGRYMNVKDASNVVVTDEGENLPATIFYLGENNTMLSYSVGQYLDCKGKNLAAVGTSLSGEFAAARTGAKPNTIMYKNNAHWTFGNRDNNVSIDRGSDKPGANVVGYDWVLEEVKWLPVPMNTTAGYATLYAPVALNNGGRVEAYVGKAEGEWFTMSRVDEEDGVIPANTPVVLKYVDDAEVENNCVYLQVSDSEKSAVVGEENELEGTFADTYITTEAYALGLVDGEVGFYTALMTEGKWLNNGFKAYLPKPATQGANALRFNFGGETTAIETVETENANAPIYDLSGRRVLSTVKGGIYIQNGKKFIVK